MTELKIINKKKGISNEKVSMSCKKKENIDVKIDLHLSGFIL